MGIEQGDGEPPEARVRSRKAVGFFSDDAAITILDDGADEERFVTPGMGLKGRVLAVVYCYRGDKRERYEAQR